MHFVCFGLRTGLVEPLLVVGGGEGRGGRRSLDGVHFLQLIIVTDYPPSGFSVLHSPDLQEGAFRQFVHGLTSSLIMCRVLFQMLLVT
jgi:hypothetical protein